MGRWSSIRNRPLNRFEAVAERLVSTPAGAWMFVNVFNRIDRRLLALSRGRVSIVVGSPVGTLETTGARSGRVRETPLLYLADGDRVVLVASNGGSPRHPAWYHNLRAHPDVRFRGQDGRRRSLRARVAEGDERAALWARVTDLYAGYDDYQLRTGDRVVPVVVLEPPTGAAA